MKLYRYLLARFQGKLSESSSKGRSAEVNGVSMHVHPRKSDNKWQLVAASVELESLPALDEQARILIPEHARQRCEVAAEHVVNLISILEACPKQIASPNLCVALAAANDAERDLLAKSRGDTGPSED